MFENVNNCNITKKELLNFLIATRQQEMMFSKFFALNVDVTKRYKTIFDRSDKNGECRFSYHDNILYFVDNAGYDKKISFNIISCVKHVFNVDINKACSMIFYGSEKRILYEKKLLTKKKVVKKTSIKFKYIDYYLIQKHFYQQFGITVQNLIDDNTYVVDNYWSNSSKDNFSYHLKNYPFNSDIILATYFPETDHTQIYMPNNLKRKKFVSNTSTDDIFGWHYVEKFDRSKPLIITKGEKDRKILHHVFGYQAIALVNEGCYIPDDKLKIIKEFNNVFLLFDNDPTGYSEGEKISTLYSFNPVFYDKELGDTAENYINLGKEKLKNILKNLIK